MALEDIPTWLSQNAVPFLIGGAVIAIAEILFKEFIWNEYVAPSFRYQIKLAKNKGRKWLRNTPIDLSYSSYTKGLEEKRVEKNKIKDVIQYLRQQNISVSDKGDIIIDEYTFGDLKFNGSVEFDIHSTSKGQIMRDLNIILNTQAHYNSLNDDITAILQATDKLKQYVAVGLDVPLEYRDAMSCKLPKLVMELAEALRDLNIEYIKFGGKASASSDGKRVVFDDPLKVPVILPELKKLVVLYG